MGLSEQDIETPRAQRVVSTREARADRRAVPHSWREAEAPQRWRGSASISEQPPRAFVGIIDIHLYEAAPLERFQISRQGRAVHGQQRGYAANARRFLAIE